MELLQKFLQQLRYFLLQGYIISHLKDFLSNLLPDEPG